ncbi:MAG: hypothetical protein ACYC9L_06705 [Sulfuricaulis sp.]
MAGKKGKTRICCKHCGSEQIVADANAVWNFRKQRWEVTDVFDKGHYCRQCDGETRIEEKNNG